MAAMTRLRPEVGGVRKDGRQERVRVGAGLALVEVGEGAEEARATGDLVQQLGDAHPRQHGVEPIPERLHLGQRGRADLADVELLSRSSTRSSSPRASRCAKRFSRQSSSRPGLPATHRPWTEGPSRRRSAPPSQPAACSCRSGDRPRTPRPTCRPSGACCAGGQDRGLVETPVDTAIVPDHQPATPSSTASARPAGLPVGVIRSAHEAGARLRLFTNLRHGSPARPGRRRHHPRAFPGRADDGRESSARRR